MSEIVAWSGSNPFDNSEIRIHLGCHCHPENNLKITVCATSQVTSEFHIYMDEHVVERKVVDLPKSSGSSEPNELVGERIERGTTGWCGERQGPYCAQSLDRHGDLREPISLQLCWTRLDDGRYLDVQQLTPSGPPKVARLAGWRDQVCVWWAYNQFPRLKRCLAIMVKLTLSRGTGESDS